MTVAAKDAWQYACCQTS